jgi:hypothetical protein
MNRGGIGLSAVLVLLVGAGEAAWLFESSGWNLMMRALSQVFGPR